MVSSPINPMKEASHILGLKNNQFGMKHEGWNVEAAIDVYGQRP